MALNFQRVVIFEHLAMLCITRSYTAPQIHRVNPRWFEVEDIAAAGRQKQSYYGEREEERDEEGMR
jgi:hypothetical protein